jgi:hypothetical protein
MRRALFLAAALLVLMGTTASAEPDIGIGVEYVFTYGSLGALQGFAITGSPPVVPLVFGLNLSFYGAYFNLGITADWWLWQRRAGLLGLYAGPGLWGFVTLGGGSEVAFGARAILGLQLWPISVLELFVEGGLNVGLRVSGGGAGLSWGVPVAAGVRFWF